MVTFWFTLLGFWSGALPFSVWLGRLALRDDIRRFGADRNPGTANAWRAGKWRLGLPVLVLDFIKAGLPVAAAHYAYHLEGWGLVPVALAPLLGHAFSPFLGLQGGKGLVTIFGAWTGLTLASGPLVLGGLFGLFYWLLAAEVWAVLIGMAGLLAYLLVSGAAAPLLGVWAGQMLVLFWKYRSELKNGLRLRPRLRKARAG